MKKLISIEYLLVFLLALFCGMSFSQEVDLHGTWKGTLEMPDSPETDEIVLILQKEEGIYKGTVSDSFGIVMEEELKDIKFEKGELTCYFAVFDGYEEMKVLISVKVEGDKMSGSLQTEDGTVQLSLELEREKKK